MNGLLNLLKLVGGKGKSILENCGPETWPVYVYTRILSRREKHRFVVIPHIHESKDQP
jgi:hypothetical protein